jgi:DNA polymerase-1
MVIGEAPGAREDEQHRAFIGPAGKLLDELLVASGLSRSECYISNACKCRPTNNDTPSRSQVKACSGYLAAEVEKVQPERILALGNTALQATTGRSGITKYRGKVFMLGEIPVLPTFHPAAALRSPRYLPAIRADIAAFSRLGSKQPQVQGTQVRLIKNLRQFHWLIRKLQEAGVIAFDFETDGLEEWRPGAELVMAGFSWEPGQAAVLPLHHPDAPWSNCDALLRRLKHTLEGHPKLVAHNGKFDARWAAASGIYLRVAFDTMLAAHILDENRSKSLESLSEIDLGMDSWKSATAGDMSNPRGIPLRRLATRNGIDCDSTLRLYYLYRELLKAEPRLARLFVKLMMPASNALTQVEGGGIWVDTKKLEDVTALTVSTVAKHVRKMDKSSGGINYNSPQQVAKWLFTDLGLEAEELTKGGAPSTKEGVLLSLAKKNKQARSLLQYRKHHKFLTTYLTPWARQLDHHSRIHTSYLLHGTVTGRLSSRGPNMQQVPRDPTVRSIFGAPDGWLLVEADYSQIELRIAAMLANETTMLRILATGRDMHYETAGSILKKLREDITTDERVIWGKHPNFGLLFGMSAGEPGRQGGYVDYCKANGIEVSYSEASVVYRRFHEAYPKLKMWHDRQKRLATRYKKVTNLFGRVRHLTDIDSSDKGVRAEAERQAINSPVQSLASDMCLSSLVRLHESFDPRIARVVGSIHDSVLSQVRATHIAEIAPLIKDTMEDMAYFRKVFGAQIDVPIEVEVKVGQSWGTGTVYAP